MKTRTSTAPHSMVSAKELGQSDGLEEEERDVLLQTTNICRGCGVKAERRGREGLVLYKASL